jgi:hypothetical protein
MTLAKELGEAVGKMTEAQEEAKEYEQKEQDRKALEQCCEEVMSWVAANLAAEKEKIRDTEVVAAGLAQVLSLWKDQKCPLKDWELAELLPLV